MEAIASLLRTLPVAQSPTSIDAAVAWRDAAATTITQCIASRFGADPPPPPVEAALLILAKASALVTAAELAAPFAGTGHEHRPFCFGAAHQAVQLVQLARDAAATPAFVDRAKVALAEPVPEALYTATWATEASSSSLVLGETLKLRARVVVATLALRTQDTVAAVALASTAVAPLRTLYHHPTHEATRRSLIHAVPHDDGGVHALVGQAHRLRELADTQEAEAKAEQLRSIEAQKALKRQKRGLPAHAETPSWHPPAWFASGPSVEGHELLTLNQGLWDAAAAPGLAAELHTVAAMAAQAGKDERQATTHAHYALRWRLLEAAPALQSGTHSAMQAAQWVEQALTLAENYAELRDLSHTAHCITAAWNVAALVPSSLSDNTAPGSGDLDTAPRWRALYCRATFHALAARNALRMPNPKATRVPMFNSVHLPPSDAVSQELPLERWAVVPDRVPFLLSTPPLPGIPVEGAVDAPCRNFARQQRHYLSTVVSDLDGQLTIDVDCERFLKLHLLKVDVCLDAFRATGKEVEGREALALLRIVRGLALDPEVFRNVLRRSEMDLGATAVTLAEGNPADRKELLQEALDSFQSFIASFTAELDSRRRLGERRPRYEGSDLPAFVAAGVRVGHTLMKLHRSAEARAQFRRVVDCVRDDPAARGNPAVAEHLALAQELAGLIPH